MFMVQLTPIPMSVAWIVRCLRPEAYILNRLLTKIKLVFTLETVCFNNLDLCQLVIRSLVVSTLSIREDTILKKHHCGLPTGKMFNCNS